MIEFVIARYATDDWRLIKWDGSDENEISTWTDEPNLEDCIRALMDYHGTGSSPFSSRDGAVDAHMLGNQCPVPTRDMTLGDETMPWQS